MRRTGRSGRNTIADALQGVLGGLESGPRVRESLALAYWSRVVGPQASAATEPEVVRDGVLFVRTKSSVWSHELTMMKAHLILELNRAVGRPVIKEIIFRAKGISAPDAFPTAEGPAESDLAEVTLTPEDQALRTTDLASLEEIPDARLRATLATRIEKTHQLRRWRLDHGWRPCERCGAAHESPESICPICRLCR
jgi:predicted nucleic acid-binding Zn ribbon protein